MGIVEHGVTSNLAPLAAGARASFDAELELSRLGFCQSQRSPQVSMERHLMRKLPGHFRNRPGS